jgi:hypothetical protein
MENENEDDLVMYEESKEIKETIWKIWDLLNDKEIINKIVLNSTLINELSKSNSQELLNLKAERTNSNKSIKKESIEKNGKINILIKVIY